MEEAQLFVGDILSLNSSLIRPAITPRFVPTCTVELMKGLSKIAAKYPNQVLIRSHISENLAEVEWVKQLHPEWKSYTDVYDKCGLMTERTVMGHGVYLSDDELKTFRERGSSISHCASSNFNIMSGVLNVRRVLDNNVKVALGTDVSGGYSFSMFDSIRQAITASKVIAINDRKHAPLLVKEAFHLGTLAGAHVLGLGNKVGNFELNKQFDALVVDVLTDDAPMDVNEDDTIEEVFESRSYLGDDRTIRQVFVDGEECVLREQRSREEELAAEK